ncbi:unnamed protein product (macronuclear) [Paramecium tetraurelia]|uniref:Chromosome undetermined scaffold_208, whole genome shotgun sequence n=1 Tax=Paramecium tetraurelia TaxID=5888 RepID=A0CLV6_PARTE|nr:uncharacterized protein GSPATT00038698001 [Paramecium tetraurelia]XP_001448838.1 uncharacterized protein GSPATT00016267001 [Paramecium tetraurelia]CAK71773.1 unnamed protein product [Paramecium tetraurelia]CAK81441.1 unnamed protein product [Paramecium tetraurelia]|eukprot:XP_001439170.1 hypothetical protein (macronuclear) [Paramecium tetraurelia strain d4-2]
MAYQQINDNLFEQQMGEIKNFKIGYQKSIHQRQRVHKNQQGGKYQKKVRGSKKISKKQLSNNFCKKSCQQDESIKIQQEDESISLNYFGENSNNGIEEIKARLFSLNLEESNQQFYAVLDSNHTFGFINQNQVKNIEQNIII